MSELNLTKEEEAVVRRLEQLELANKSREAENFLERVEEVHATVKGLLDGTVDAEELEKQHHREVLRKRAKEIRKEEAATRAREELHMGSAGKGEGKRPYTYFCRYCLVIYELEDLRCCNRCGRELQTRAQRVAELQQRVQTLKEEKLQHASRKARWRRWLQTKKILKSSRLVVDYAAWERWEPSTDEEEKQNEPPVTPADDENFQALEQDLRTSARSRARRRAVALRCKDRGNALFKKGDWLGALQAYEEGLEQSRDVKELWTNKSLVLLKMQRYEEAHEAATRILEYCEIFEDGYTSSVDACFKAFSRRALANRALRRFDGALADLEQAVELQPKDKQVQQLLQQTQLQVEQLHQLEHLQRVGLEEKNCEEAKLQSSDVCRREKDGAPDAQELPEKVRGREDILKRSQKELQAESIVEPPTAPHKTADVGATKACNAASAAGAGKTSASHETVVNVAAAQSNPSIAAADSEPSAAVAAADSELSAAAAATEFQPSAAVAEAESESSAAAGQVPVLHSTVETSTQKKQSGRIMTEVKRHGTGTDAGSQHHAVSNTPSHLKTQTAFHAASSNQTTSTATPKSPSPSSHASGVEVDDVEEQHFSGVTCHSPVSSSNLGQSVGSVERNSGSAALGARPSYADTASILRSPQQSASHLTTSATRAAADTSAERSSPSDHNSQRPSRTPSDVQAADSPPSCSTVSSTVVCARPVTAINNATKALQEMQLLLRPAVTAGSFATIEPSTLMAALKLLRFAHVKLAFCCSPLDHPGISSTADCSTEMGHQRQGLCSSRQTEKSGRETGEKQDEDGVKDAPGTVSRYKTFVDICTADLRSAALHVRRQRRERKENTAAMGHTSDTQKDKRVQEEPGTGKCHIQSPSLPTHFDLYPHACFPALQLLHRICFIEETGVDMTRSAESATIGHSRSHEKLSNTNSDSNVTSRENQSGTDTGNKSVETAATPPWLLEVCEAAAPYLLTLTSELLQLFMPYNSSVLMLHAQDTTADPREKMSNAYCGCHSRYKLVPHAGYHARGANRGMSHDSAADRRLKKEELLDGTSVSFCPWGACAAALATSMSLLQQLSVAPLTRRKLSEHLQRANDGHTVLFGTPTLLLCCLYEATVSSSVETTNTSRVPSGRKQLAAPAPEESILSSSEYSSDSVTVSRSEPHKIPRSWAAVGRDTCEKHLQQARRDAGALFCNMLLEQPVLHQLLLQQQTSKSTNDDILLQQAGLLGCNQLTQHLSIQQHSYSVEHPGDRERMPEADDVGIQLRLLLSRRLRALLAREKLLQDAEEAAVTLIKQMESGQLSQQLLPMLWKQAMLLQQLEEQDNDTYRKGAPHREDVLSDAETRRDSFSNWASLVYNNNVRLLHDTDRLLGQAEGDSAERDKPFSEVSTSAVDMPQTEKLINKLLLSAREAEALEAHAHIPASTEEEDPLLREAQQALDMITNMARSSAGRIFVLTHLKKELIVVLALCSTSVSGGEKVASTNTNCVSLSVLETSQQQDGAKQAQQLEASRVLRQLLTPRQNHRSRGFFKVVDVLGLLLNLTFSPGSPSVVSSSSSQRQLQQCIPANVKTHISLQQQFLLSGGTQYGLLPLLLSHVDKLIHEQQRKHSSASGGVLVPTATHATTEDEDSQVIPAGLRSLTIISRLVATAATATAEAPSAVVVKGREATTANEKQKFNKNLSSLPFSPRSLICSPVARQEHISVSEAHSAHYCSTRHRGLIECLLRRVLKLLTPPSSSQYAGPQQNMSRQQGSLHLQQQTISGEKHIPMWTEVHNASLLMLCALTNMNVDCVLETAATTPANLDTYERFDAASSQPQTGSSKRMQGHSQERGEAEECNRQQTQREQNENQGRSRESALQEIARVICGWLQVLKPTSYAHERTEMRDRVAMARGNFLLLVGHLAKAQSAAINMQQQNIDKQPRKYGEPLSSQQKVSPQQQHCGLPQGAKEGERKARQDAAAVTGGAVVANASTDTNALKNPARMTADSLQQQLAELDLRLCIHCCVESLRKDLEGPQKNAAIALAALARIPTYRPHIDALKGFESLMQIAAPKLLGKR